jgi:alkyl hydroperoxide reductase subunit AhpF
MPFLSASDQNEIKRLFQQLTGDVTIHYFTQRESPIFIPGQECASCKDTRLILEEVAALSDKLHLEVHDFVADSQLAREHSIDKIPALVMTAEGVKGKVRYFGMPSGYEFSVLLGGLVDVSQAKSELAPETIEALAAVTENLHIQVFTTPT